MKPILYFTLAAIGIVILLGTAVPVPADELPPISVDDTGRYLFPGTADVPMEEAARTYLPVLMAPDTSIEPYRLITPADGAQLDTLIPWMEFAPGDLEEDAGGCLVVAKEPDQTNCKMSFGPRFNRFAFVYFNNLEPDTTYYWRVGAVYDYDYDNIVWGSQQWSFTSGPAGGPIPPAPVLVSPADFSTIAADTITLAWEAVDGAAEYRVSVDDEVSGRGYVTSGIFPPDTQAGPDKIGWIFDIADGPHFSWYVKTRNAYAWSRYSAPYHFTVEE